MVVQSPLRTVSPPRSDSLPLLVNNGASTSNFFLYLRLLVSTKVSHIASCRVVQLAFLAVSVLICLVIYTTVRGSTGGIAVPSENLVIKNIGPMENGKRRKVILFWTQWFDKPYCSLWDNGGVAPFLKRCPKDAVYSDCEVTDDRNRIQEADAVVFHIPDLVSKVSLTGGYDVPSYRSPNQRYVFYNQESPVHTLTRLSVFANFFNWTMTYRRDSDIWAPYATFRPISESVGESSSSSALKPAPSLSSSAVLKSLPKPSTTNMLLNKTDWVAWVVSRCFTHSRREQYIESLQQFIPVDMYGRCGSRPCGQACFADIAKRYRFYVSIENSLCTDYVTEKFFSRMRELDAVLIVLQPNNASATIRDNYANLAPPNSYIDASKFGSPRALAGYLRAVGNEPALFSSFFSWRKNMTIKKTEFEPVCDLCKLLHKSDVPAKSYADIKEWWVGGTNRKADGSLQESASQPHCQPGARFTADGDAKYPPFAVPYFVHIMGS